MQLKKRILKSNKILRKKVSKAYKKIMLPKNPKIFCIGMGKTGTTSLQAEFIRQGFLVGDQRAAEHLAPNYMKGDFESIIKYCKSARVFQDVPFAWPETFKHLDKAFPDAKFILSVRDSPEQWFNSRVKFDTKRYGGKLPSLDDVKNNNYVYPGWSYDNLQFFHNGDINKRYDKDYRIAGYNKHNAEVKKYFADSKDKLLVLNVGKPEDYLEFCSFMGLSPMGESFPWKNKS